MAVFNEKIIGSVALERINDKEYTLAKMGVKPAYQGKKVGRLLLETAINKAQELNLESLFLYTNHQLVSALNLYLKYGFKFMPVNNAAFDRATVKMQLKL